MKRNIIKLFILLLTFTAFSYAIYFEKEEDEHIFHVHIYEVYAETVNEKCPVCGNTLSIEFISVYPTCTTAGSGSGYCPADGVEGFAITIQPLGHEYDYNKPISSVEAGCLTEGSITYACQRCGDTTTSNIAALGHNYKSKVTKEATCTEDGVHTYTCDRCQDKYTRKIEALGHDIEYEEVEPTCLEDGYKKGVCKRCGEETNEVYAALGHDIPEMKTVKEATCDEDGRIEGTCQRCNETISDILLRKGHKYPTEWTIEKEPTFFNEGLKYKVCSVCGHRLEEILPHKDQTPVYLGGGGVAVLAAAGIFLYTRKARKLVKKATKEAIKESIEPEFEDKSILVASVDESLLKTLKSKKFLEVSTCEKEEIEEQAKETEADLLIADVDDEESFNALICLKDEVLPKQNIALVVGEEYYKENKEKLDSFVEDKTIINYVKHDAKDYEILTKLVLPVLKPNLKSDEALANIGAVADALGIPGISSVIDVYVNGRDIKATIEEGELSVSSTATVIGDIASILGLDTVASVAGLVDDVDSVKAAVDKEAGAYERKYGVEGAKDIVDVVSDIISKDE